MTPGVRADRVSGFRDLLEDFGIIGRVLADHEERRLHALLGECRQHFWRGRPGTVVEGQQHFVVAQEIVLLEMFEAEAGAAGGVDFDDAGDAQRVRIFALHGGGRRRGSLGILGPGGGAGER